jgi:biotin carboxyl carrier protein
MKQYKVTVNGQSYDVAVEEVGMSPARPAAPAQAAPPPRPAAPAPAPSPATPASAPQAVSVSIKSPMPGTVLSFKVELGQDVKRGDVLLILEAMKMENEIVANQAGKVVALRVPAGSSVNTGDPLVDLA